MKILHGQRAKFLILTYFGLIHLCSCTEEELNKSDENPTIELSDGDAEILSNLTGSENITFINATAEAVQNVTYRVSCLVNNTEFSPVVEIVNSTSLLLLMQIQANVTSLKTPATCLVVLFYSPSCPFSCMAAPHFNALPRLFPSIRMAAVDTSRRYNFNAQYGIVGLPSVLLFHNGRPAARFNSSSEFVLEEFVRFVTNNTGLQPEGKLHVTSEDFAGPISSVPIQQTDYCLWLSWLFIFLCSFYVFYYSEWCQWLMEAFRNAWREAEAQRQHAD